MGPYTYRLNFDGGFNSNNNFNNLGAGDYTAFVRDQTGCERSVVFTISPYPALTVSAQSVSDVLCAGQNNGQVTVQGGGGRAPYQFALGNGAFSNDPTFTGLGATTYTFRVRDADFCESSVQIAVSAPNALVVSNVQREPGDCNSTLRPSLVTFTGRANGTVQNPNPNLEISTDNGATWAQVEEVFDNGTVCLRQATTNGGAVYQTWNIRKIHPYKA